MCQNVRKRESDVSHGGTPFMLQVGRYCLEYGHGYGIDNRSGWTATVDGSSLREFVSLRRALTDIVREWWGGKSALLDASREHRWSLFIKGI